MFEFYLGLFVKFFFDSFPQIATIFGGIAVITSLLTILCLVLMIFLKSTTVFHLCGWMQILSGEKRNCRQTFVFPSDGYINKKM